MFLLSSARLSEIFFVAKRLPQRRRWLHVAHICHFRCPVCREAEILAGEGLQSARKSGVQKLAGGRPVGAELVSIRPGRGCLHLPRREQKISHDARGRRERIPRVENKRELGPVCAHVYQR